MSLYDWLMLTSIACLIVITGCLVYLLSRTRKRIETQTIMMKQSHEQLKEAPKQMKNDMNAAIDEMKSRLKLAWRIVSYIRQRRKKRKLKKRMMS